MSTLNSVEEVGGSFRDPSGYVFLFEGTLYRQVHQSYQRHYDLLIKSGLYEDLVRRGMLVAHEEIENAQLQEPSICKILRPQQIPFISYPYEWCFSQLKDAALLTLSILKRALAHGMILKDANAFNIQFHNGSPILIDTLSFERYHDGQPWIAYRQFCQHFLAPLALMCYKDIRLSLLTRAYMDGIPLGLATSLLPKRALLNSGILMHLHLHARAQRRHAGTALPTVNKHNRLTMKSLQNIGDSLRATIEGLRWNHERTDWADYYEGDSYLGAGFYSKLETVSRLIETVKPRCLWDLGANTGAFSRIASQQGIPTISIDSDPGVVEANYQQAKQEKDAHLHPLLIDLTNPSAAVGWANRERESLLARCNADCALALALIHHLAISNNLPFSKIAECFATISKWLIIEFVPKSDKKVQQLLISRKDIFDDYTQSSFEREFGKYYAFVETVPVTDSDRIIYLLRRT